MRRATLAVMTAAVMTLLSAGAAQALTMITKTAVPLRADGYRFLQVPPGTGDGFQAPGFDASAFGLGAAPFGSSPNLCSAFGTPATPWEVDTDILVRRTFTLPAGATGLRVTGTIDNDATVYLNGVQVGETAFSGFCEAGAIDVTADDALLRTGANVLAVRGHDYGGSTFLDQQVTYDVPQYRLCLLYDPAKAHRSGSTVPLKLQVCDEAGNDLSSPDLVVHASGLRKIDGSAAAEVEDAGSANPSDDFRFSPDLPGYIFNKQTKGLSTGTWEVDIEVGGDAGHAVRFDVR